ncbi:hypothetical protein RFI_38321, partial [Reticulomyxa filosa]
SEEENHRELKAVIRRNSIWGIISVTSFFVTDFVHLFLFAYGVNIIFFLNTTVLLLNNFIMVRIMGWQMIYAKYLQKIHFKELLCGICQQMECIKSNTFRNSNIDQDDTIGRAPTVRSDIVSVSPALRTHATLEIDSATASASNNKEESYVLMVERTSTSQA